ncbi:MFS transporter [Kolteria novifilia]
MDKPAAMGAPPRSLYDRNFALTFIAQSLFVLANTLLVHYARWIAFLGGDELDIGWVMGFGAVTALLVRPWIGLWIDRLGALTMWMVGLTLFIISALTNFLLADVGVSIYVVRSLNVISTAIFFSASLTYITLMAPPDRRAEAIGTLGAAGFVGMMCGPWLGDWFVEDGDRSFGDFYALFGSAAGAIAIALVITYFGLREPPHLRTRSSLKVRHFIENFIRYWPGVVLSANVIFGVCLTVPFVFLARYLDVLDMGGYGVGEFFVVYGGTGITVRLALRRLPDQIGWRKMLLAGLCVLGAGMFSYLLVDPNEPWTILIPATVSGMAHGLVFPSMMALVTEPFPNEARGTGSVLAIMSLDTGMVCAPPLMGVIAYTLGYGWMFTLTGCATFAVTAWILVSSLNDGTLFLIPVAAPADEVTAVK